MLRLCMNTACMKYHQPFACHASCHRFTCLCTSSAAPSLDFGHARCCLPVNTTCAGACLPLAHALLQSEGAHGMLRARDRHVRRAGILTADLLEITVVTARRCRSLRYRHCRSPRRRRCRCRHCRHRRRPLTAPSASGTAPKPATAPRWQGRPAPAWGSARHTMSGCRLRAGRAGAGRGRVGGRAAGGGRPSRRVVACSPCCQAANPWPTRPPTPPHRTFPVHEAQLLQYPYIINAAGVGGLYPRFGAVQRQNGRPHGHARQAAAHHRRPRIRQGLHQAARGGGAGWVGRLAGQPVPQGLIRRKVCSGGAGRGVQGTGGVLRCFVRVAYPGRQVWTTPPKAAASRPRPTRRTHRWRCRGTRAPWCPPARASALAAPLAARFGAGSQWGRCSYGTAPYRPSAAGTAAGHGAWGRGGRQAGMLHQGLPCSRKAPSSTQQPFSPTHLDQLSGAQHERQHDARGSGRQRYRRNVCQLQLRALHGEGGTASHEAGRWPVGARRRGSHEPACCAAACTQNNIGTASTERILSRFQPAALMRPTCVRPSMA